ncbi:EexN family lipoprotein [Aureimonas sp. N4]|uniref:EexN family lipoprotein n=1 Tax=Aureimonas sp. N4 TaxID=1638165 RepID=UPI00078344E8|nr:EexN family lipoprotein [Aureimonas sp. N4]
MTKASRSIVPLMAVLLASCGSETPRAVSFFQENGTVRAKVLNDCRTGEHRGEECDNANKAEHLVRHAHESAEDQREIDSWITR